MLNNRCALLITISLVFFSFSARAEEAMSYVYNGPESELDHRYDYQWDILRTALDRTAPQYGPYELTPSTEMTENRQTQELLKASGVLTVMHLGTTEALEKNLLPIRIPVDKNLSGYMVYLIRGDDQAKFSAVQTLDNLREISIGQGQGWLDVEILENSNFNVITGTSYDGLFSMLLHNRFDAFQRSSAEILDEYDLLKESMPDLHIEQDILFYYPLPMYFWFSKTPQGALLAERAEAGMMAMIEDGTYDEIFMKYNAHKIERLRLKDRKLFKIENPLLGRETPFDDHRLWYNPLK